MSPHAISTTANDLVNEYADIIKGKIILTTGVTPNSLGGTFIQETASKSPRLLILAGRSASKLQDLASTITKDYPDVKTRNLIVDLGSLASVRRAADEVNSWEDVPSIDVVVNNAGVMAIPYSKTEDGYEKQFAICHLGHFLLTNLIMNKILASKSPRVVNISSNGHSLGPVRFADPHFSVSIIPSFSLNNANKFRTARLTMIGLPTVKRKLPTSSFLCPLLRSWEAVVYSLTACTQASSLQLAWEHILTLPAWMLTSEPSVSHPPYQLPSNPKLTIIKSKPTVREETLKAGILFPPSLSKSARLRTCLPLLIQT